MTLLPRYHYEFYRDPGHPDTSWGGRAQWLIFDRNGVGCVCSVGYERDAAKIVFALNLLDGKKDARQFEDIPWREGRRDREAAARLASHA